MTDAGPLLAPPPSPAFVARGLSLRPRRADDGDFLRDVYVAARWDELQSSGWPEAARIAFLHSQHELQRRNYDLAYPDGAFLVVDLHGRPAGRLYLLLRDGDLRVMDIALMPACRGQGLGELLLRAVIDRAADLGAGKVSAHVEANNPARRLYHRLGFAVIEERGPYLLIERPGD